MSPNNYILYYNFNTDKKTPKSERACRRTETARSIPFCDRGLKNCIAAKAAQQAAMLPSYVHFVNYAVAFYTAAEAA